MWKGARVHIPSREREGGPQSTLLRQRPYCALNDLAILYGGRDIIIAIRVTAGETLQCKRGLYFHDDLIGKLYGTTVNARSRGGGHVILLHPTCELWARSLLLRTQVLFPHDIAVVVSNLGLRPGLRVVETGTGSGVLTHSLARAVAPSGNVFTFELNPGRAAAAQQEFADNGLSDVVVGRNANACIDGFVGVSDGHVHAVFLDLPSPWEVIAEADRVLVPNGMLCSFSPCIEQVQRSCAEMRAVGFRELRTVEVLTRSAEAKMTSIDSLDISPWETNVAERVAAAVSKRQAAAGNSEPVATDAAAAAADGDSEVAGDRKITTVENDGPRGVKRVPEDISVGDAPDSSDKRQKSAAEGRTIAWPTNADISVDEQRIVYRPMYEQKGHTGYLTFARRRLGTSSPSSRE